MNVLSLFDGMSCGQIALNRIGIVPTAYYASEIDKPAQKVSAANFPNTIYVGDVRNVDVSKLPPIDLLIGGSPCQSFSFAGKRKPTIYFRPITFETVCKNGNWKYGGNAITTMSDDINFGLEMAVHQYGKTQKEAEDKLIKFLNGNGANEIECIEPPCKHEFVQREYSSQPYGTCISCGKTILS